VPISYVKIYLNIFQICFQICFKTLLFGFVRGHKALRNGTGMSMRCEFLSDVDA